jgi:uncharacterized RDD family membrane protein YckC
MNFFRKIKDSIYSPAFYFSVHKRPLSSAVGYMLLLSLLLTIFASISPIYRFSTDGQAQINKFVNQVKNFYPQDLEIKIKDGKVSTNVKEPYVVPVPWKYHDKNVKQTINDFPNLIVIDTKTPFSVDQFNQYNAYIWIARDSVFIKNNGKIEANGLSKTPDTTINKTLVASIINKFLPYLIFINPLAIIMILIGIFLAHALRLIYLFILALLIWPLANILKKPLSYGESYRVGVYAITLGMLVELILGWSGSSGFPFMFTLVSLFVVLINFLQTPTQAQIDAYMEDEKEISKTQQYGGFFQRLIAYIIDTILINVAFTIICSIFVSIFPPINGIKSSFISFIIFDMIYVVWMTGANGATVGKMAMKLKITNEDGSKISYTTALIREISTYLSLLVLCIGYLNVIWDGKKQGWHDKIAKTIVVRTDQLAK